MGHQDDSKSDAANPLLAWHGTNEEKLNSICAKGFLNLAEVDSGESGRIIFTILSPD